jgi:signal transduction histidine kinase
MRLLINDLLTYSQANTIDQIFEITDLNEIMTRVQDDFKEALEEKKAIVTVAGLQKIKVIPFQFNQMFHNLVSNAIKYSSEDRQLTISITCKSLLGKEIKEIALLPAQTYCHIAVSDNGIGFDEQYKERIFEMFRRLHGKSEYSGTGIGLAIVKKIVDNHNGIITASSAVNEGATFDIYIPC